jgi:hypothetical protein
MERAADIKRDGITGHSIKKMTLNPFYSITAPFFYEQYDDRSLKFIPTLALSPISSNN